MAIATSSLTFGQRAQQRLAQTLAMLPPALQVRLSRREPVSVDGETLAPEVQLMLTVMERSPQAPLETLSPERAREMRRRLAAVYGGRPVVVGAVRDVDIEASVPLRARHYAPVEPGGPHGLLVYFHGGGFTYGDLDTHDGLCRLLCRHAGAHVLAVDYRLAPEHRFPAAVEDARAALRWAFANAAALGADERRVGVCGDSAGGNLAAVVSQLAAHDDGPAPVLQVLFYPATDCTRRRRSRELFGEGFLLTNAQMDWFETNYLGESRSSASDPRASPLLAADLSGLAPTLVVTAGFDPLRDEGEEYVEALRAAGTPATLRRFPGLTHAFLSATGVSRTCREALIEVAGATRAMFAAARAPVKPLAEQLAASDAPASVAG
jgi:acetyl esterase